MSSTTATSTPRPSQVPTSHLLIYNAHNGATMKIPKPVRFHSIGAFKSFLYETFSNYHLGGELNIFLLTSFGIKFNFNMINELNDVYVYDKRLFSPSPSSSQILEQYFSKDNELQGEVPKKQLLAPVRPLSNPKSLKEMTENLKIMESWASHSVLMNCKALETLIKATVKQINTIFKCFSIIFHFGTNFIGGIEKNFNSYFNYIKLTNMKTLHRSWQQYHRNLAKNFPIVQVGVQPSSSSDNSNGVTIKLVDLLDSAKLELSLEYIALNLPKVVSKFNEMSLTITEVNREKLDIDVIIEQLRNESIHRFKDHEEKTSAINSKIHTAIREMSEALEEIGHNSSTLQIESTYHSIANGKLVEILNLANQLYEINSELLSFRKKISTESVNIFEGIANLQMKMVALKEELRGITEEKDQRKNGNNKNNSPLHDNSEISFEIINRIKREEDYLSLTIDLPLLFGFMLIEKRRQYEWYDFYSKGVVKNISEQLSIMIEHEKVFRKLWIKKFGGFLSLLGAASDVAPPSGVPGGGLLYPKLPSIDVTLVNGEMENDEFNNILRNVLINRNDILKYIDALKQYLIASTTTSPSSKNFHTILEKNFLDLVKSTSNMKKVTKLVSSISTLTSPNSEEMNNSKFDNQLSSISHHGKRLGNGGATKEKSVELDSDLNVIKGLKSRINKLENLLHQLQYKNLSQWPVTRETPRNGSNDNGTMAHDSNFGQPSLIIDRKSYSNSSKINPTAFLNKTTNPSTPPSPVVDKNGNRTVLDASTTIDKHLDNIRLRKENNELSQENDRLHGENQSKDELIRQLRLQINSSKEREREANEKLAFVTNAKEMKEVSFQNDKRDKDERISSLQAEVSKYLALNNDKFEETLKLNKIVDATRNEFKDLELKYKSLREEVQDSNDMKNDLLSNMSAKEGEYAKERSTFEEEIKALKGKLEEVTDDYEDLMELTQSKQKNNEQLIDELNFIGNDLVFKIKQVMQLSFNFYYDFCLVLESMGLLLVKEFNESKKIEEMKVIRVKGLRSKKDKDKEKTTNLLDEQDVTVNVPLKPTSKVVENLSNMVTWVDEIGINPNPQDSIEHVDGNDVVEVARSNEEIVPDSSHGQLVIKTFKDYFEGPESKFNELLENLRFPASEMSDMNSSVNSTNYTAFVAAISKRFRDVEGFAKKLTKENRSKTHEISKLSTKMANKISMNDFQVGDLVLFLPTRIDRMSEFEENFQPWAAFNFRSPHYFLKVDSGDSNGEGSKVLHNLKGKDWMVGRIVNITSHLVSEENVDGNPFLLSNGVNWYHVEAKEVDLA